MTEKILIIKNIARENPGLIGRILHEQGLDYDVVDLSRGENFPSVKGYRAVIVLGGPASANDEDEKMKQQIERIRECLAMKIPYLGICLGLQILVKAAGGKVVKNPVKEIGFRDDQDIPYEVELTREGERDPLFEGLRSPFRVFQLHGETIVRTEDMGLMGTGRHCPDQIVKVGENAYGIQCHFELTEAMLDIWCHEDPDLIPLNRTQVLSEFAFIREAYEQTANVLFGNFLKTTGVSRS